MLYGQRTYYILALMLISLVVLAFFQYRWLGQVSEAEQKRVRENMEASSRNFIEDFDEVFGEVQAQFRIQILSEEADISEELSKAYAEWLINSEFSNLVDTLYYIKSREDEDSKLFRFDISKNELETYPWTEKLIYQRNVISMNANSAHNNIGSNWSPNFGEPSFIYLPIQLLRFVEMENNSIKLNLSIDKLSDYVLVQLNDDVIHDEIIPGLSRDYFSDSYDDQFYINIVHPSRDSTIYYSSTNIEQASSLPSPDIQQSLDLQNISSVLIFDQKGISTTNSLMRDENVMDLIHSSENKVQIKTEYSASFFNDDTLNINNSRSRFNFSESDTSDIENTTELARQALLMTQNSLKIDTSITSTFSFKSASMTDDWELWVTSKAGSIGALVTNTRNKNMAISFFILLVLGICSFMIVAYSRKSEALAEQQMMFVAGVSHELRTPLAVIRSAADNMLHGLVKTEEKQEEYAKLVSKEGIRLSNMVDQILEYSGIQSGKKTFNFQTTSIHPFIDQVKDDLADYIKEERAELHIQISSELDSIQIDTNSIALSLNNLISNAIKFSEDDKNVYLNAEPSDRNNESGLLLEVKDEGIGIPTEELAHIFDPFFRGTKPASNQIKGNGIGLSLVKKIVDAHGGSITVQSEVDKGSTFSIWLPFNQSTMS